MADLDWLVQFFINDRRTPEDARKFLLMNFPVDLVNEAFEKFRELAGSRKYLTPPPMLVKSKIRENEWYIGGDQMPGAKFWPALKLHLSDTKKWETNAIQSINTASDKLVAWLESPWAAKIQTRGLVVGYVQSGKTANFTAVIAKAADAGYRFFIVLSGTKKSLRQQTQLRLERELISLNSDLWFSPTTHRDFSPIGNVNFFLSDKKHDKILCVIKKNKSRLTHLTNWLRGASPDLLRQCPFLIIDDEADEASVNTAPGQAYSSPDVVTRTRINQLVVELLKLLPKAAYIGYTATPFANVFIDPNSPDDLYPGDFIVSLPKPLGHFGTEQIFGRDKLLDDETDEEYQGPDMVRVVPVEEIPLLKPRTNDRAFVPEVTNSLAHALRYFWLACAARHYRGQDKEFSTMLIHTTQLIAVHNSTRQQIENYRINILTGLQNQDLRLLSELEARWNDEHFRVPSESFGYSSITFEQLRPYLLTAVQATLVVVDNSQSPFRLSYDDPPKIQIAIGGNTLSRGLTLEGLVVSFFVRAASAYDTLLQMGRWFGYRPGYADLPRIWMTDELAGYFFDVATTEAEIRRDIENYDLLGVTPRQFGLKVRAHPDLAITAPLKMQFAVPTEVSYSETRVQTILFEHQNYAWLKQNIEVTSTLITNLLSDQFSSQAHNGHILFRNIPVSHILKFINTYNFHKNSRTLSARLLGEYIKDQNRHGVLNSWNIIIRGVIAKEKLEREPITLGGLQVPLLQRARRRFPLEYAHIGVLMSKGDIGADLPLSLEDLKGRTDEELESLREQMLPGMGLLAIYPISKDSKPGKGSKKDDLNALEHVIGLGLVFPKAEGDSRSAQSYMIVDPSRLDQTDLEFDEEAEDEE